MVYWQSSVCAFTFCRGLGLGLVQLSAYGFPGICERRSICFQCLSAAARHAVMSRSSGTIQLQNRSLMHFDFVNFEPLAR